MKNGFFNNIKSSKEYLGFVGLTKTESLFEVYQLKLWSNELLKKCVLSGAERQRERSEAHL